LPISAVDAISPAFEHTKQQLLKPLRINQWAKLALVGFLAGELSSGGGGCNSPQMPRNAGDFSNFHFPHFDPRTVAMVITAFIVSAFVLWVLFTYLNSMMRFVLFDSVIAKECHIRESWRRRHEAGMRFFVWHIVLALITWGTMVILIGVPAAIAFSAGWFKQPGDHIFPLVLGGIFVFLVFFILFVGILLVMVLTKDFVVPQMALENITAFEGWRRLLPMMKAEKGGYATYIGMKFVLAIAAGIIFGIATFILTLILLIPAGAIGVAAVLAGKAAGMTWGPVTIAWAVVSVIIAFLVIMYLVSFISVPGIVFFPAYSLYFFAARYPALNAILNPAPPAPPLPSAPPPYLPPPQPIG
jgi:hypothetical protein